LSETIVAGFGGIDVLISTAQNAFGQRKYNLAAKLLSYALEVEPDNPDARQLKADALRAMAQTTRSGIQTRNFLLAHTLHLEGKLDWTKPPEVSFFGPPTVEAVLATPPGTYLKLLEAQVDPAKCAGVETVVNVRFSDLHQTWSIHVRRGVIEVTDGSSPEAEATLQLPRPQWAEIALGETSIDEAVASGRAQIEGSAHALSTVFAAVQSN
jgi:alkyl sulfatase BDS1-like metallo-beta-lactamase superfamily hydrolase